ncbi:aromatic ring-opening dioxygenase LigA [Curtobacterium sp. RIT-PI-V]|uniref:aromatic ring-opening dioxygenase LigA n=1 Tax=Curtobacterium sp. RIT-PI-V TaxID=3035296 RepID=UPI0021D81D5F|nr:aromatic ring-opening dioxygenase LigA [Curtobacterium sp. RIT-PI-V]
MTRSRRQHVRTVRNIGTVGILAGGILSTTGAVVWGLISAELTAQKITVSPDSKLLPERPVRGPLTAYAQAEIINTHATAISDGKTFAELPQNDPNRPVIMNASFLRASLFTSVVSFGTAAFAIGLGLVTSLFGVALRRLGK